MGPADAAGKPRGRRRRQSQNPRYKFDIGNRKFGTPADAASKPRGRRRRQSQNPRYKFDIGNREYGTPADAADEPRGGRHRGLHDPAGTTSASIREVWHRATTANCDSRLTSGTATSAFLPIPLAAPE